MPRKPRFFVPGVAAHVVQRGNNHQAIFFECDDYRCYLSLLCEAIARYGCAVHATNHVHLLLTPEALDSISRAMQYIEA